MAARALWCWVGAVTAMVVVAACGSDEPLPAGDASTAGLGGSAGTGGGVDAAPGSGGTHTGGSPADAAADAPTDALADAGSDAAADAPSDALAQIAPDFSLMDENPASASHAQLVSPRDYLGTVSAWYFGHAT